VTHKQCLRNWQPAEWRYDRSQSWRKAGNPRPATGAWQSSSSSWPMSVAACRSRCRRRPPPRSCARAYPCRLPRVFSARAVGICGLKRRKVKLEPFLIFNQQFLTLIRAGLPILGSLQMLAKIQKNAHLPPVGRRFNRVKTGESLSSAFEAQSGFRSCTPPRCWPASAPAICRRCWSATSASSGLAHLPQEADHLAHLSGVLLTLVCGADGLHVRGTWCRSLPRSTTRWARSCRP
jgi:hypothetical protein